jgi:uncharacterized repeat protein (TIGR01451 family)
MCKLDGFIMEMSKLMKFDIAYAALLAGAAAIGSCVAFVAPAYAQTATKNIVSLQSDAMIERSETGVDGRERTVLKKPTEVVVVPGDRVVFTLSYHNKGAEPATGFRATNPMPGPVQFVAATEDWAEVSVDGGKNWGKLSDLKVPSTVSETAEPASAFRPAGPEDVTHVRWVFTQPIAPGSEGNLTFRGVIK